MNNKEFFNTIQSKLQHIIQNENSNSFTETMKIKDDYEIVVECNSEYNDEKWDSETYATTITVKILAENPNVFKSEQDKINTIKSRLEQIFNEKFGFKGPIVLRPVTDENERVWSRKLLLDKQ